jgi:hypothetical protein
MKLINLILLTILSLSICLNLFQRRNQAVKCDNLDAAWKADLLYTLGHKWLDGDKDWVACDNLHPNQN